MLVKCDHCGKEINKKPSYIKNNVNKNYKNYCSKECSKVSKQKGTICDCAYCGVEIYKSNAQIKKSKNGNMFCNSSCAASFNNKLTKSNKSKNYSKIAFRNYVNNCSICNFDIKETLEVHHIDLNRLNNDLNNLIILCANCHTRIHYGNLVITQDIIMNRKYIINCN